MKNNLENKFKELFQEFEVPYETGAWEAMSDKLGRKPKKTPTSSKLKTKIAVAALLTGVIAFGVYQFTLKNNPENKNAVVLENDNNTDNKKTITSNKEEKDYVSSTGNKTENEIQTTNIEKNTIDKNTESKSNVTKNEENKPHNFSKENAEDLAKLLHQKDTETIENNIVEEVSIKNRVRFGSGIFSATAVCAGETIRIDNPADTEKMVRFKYNNEWMMLSPGTSFEFIAQEEQEIHFVDEKNAVLETSNIKIYPTPNIDFTFDANIFEKGLPIIQCEAFGDLANHEWTFNDDKEVLKGNKINYYAFDKGEYQITLTSTNIHGCKNSVEKKVSVLERYNLMAVDAFMPNGSDNRNRTFMPYSLTERNVKFDLKIIDPINSEVVFTSTNATQAWDGTNQRTGKMTPSGKAYIWKVRIYNPLPNERPIYTGTIVHN